jgi:polyphenol oxidase
MNLTPLTSAPVLPRSSTNGLPAPSDSFEWRRAPWGDVLVCRALEDVAAHFFTGRELQLRGGTERARADWAQVAHALGLPADRLWRMKQVHGCDVFSVGAAAVASVEDHSDSPEMQARRPHVDGIVTNRTDVGLAVQVADCVPLLFADPRTGAISATHAGWRGTALNVAGAAVARLAHEHGVRPSDLIVAIGPSIGPACFQVGPEVREAFLQQQASASPSHAGLNPAAWFTPDTGDRLRLDIWRANCDQLLAAGLRPEHIHLAGLCTVTHVRHFFSYRLEQQTTGRMVGAIRRLDRDPR